MRVHTSNKNYLCLIVRQFLIIALLWGSSFYVQAEEELPSPPPEADPSLSGANPNSVQTCAEIEVEFQSYLTEEVQSSRQNYQDIYDCISGTTRSDIDCNSVNTQTMQQLTEFRHQQKLLYELAASREIERLDESFNGIGSLCFTDSEGKIEFGTHLHQLIPQIDDPRCNGITREPQLARRAIDILNGFVEIPELNEAELESLKSIVQSPLAQSLPRNTKYLTELSEAQLAQSAATAFNELQHRSGQIATRIEEMSPTRLYQLYAFQNQFEAFNSTRESEAQSTAQACKESSTFTQDCRNLISSHSTGPLLALPRLIASGGLSRRCSARLGDFGRELLPFIPVIDGVNGIRNARDAFSAGIMTREEYNRERISASLNAVLGMGGITSVARGVIRGGINATRSGIRSIRELLDSTRQRRLAARNPSQGAPLRNADDFVRSDSRAYLSTPDYLTYNRNQVEAALGPIGSTVRIGDPNPNSWYSRHEFFEGQFEGIVTRDGRSFVQIRNGDDLRTYDLAEFSERDVTARLGNNGSWLERSDLTQEIRTSSRAFLNSARPVTPARNAFTGEPLAITPYRPQDLTNFLHPGDEIQHANTYYDGLRQAYTQYNHVLANGNGASVYHGSRSGSLLAFLSNRRLGGLRPTGVMREQGINPLTGELGAGVSEFGINQTSLSTVKISDLDAAIHYARGSVTGRGVSDETLASLTDVERLLFTEPFPVLYGLSPNQPAIGLRVSAGRRGDITEVPIEGGVDFSGIQSIFVPEERVAFVRRILREAGLHRTIHVAPIDPVL